MARKNVAKASPLAETIVSLYGMPAGPFAALPSVYDAAVEHFTNSMSYDGAAYERFAARYAGRGDAMHAAFENGSSWSSTSDAIGLLTNAVLVAVPYRHEAIWVELDAPHAVWLYAEGWSQLAASIDETTGAPSRFLERIERSAWLRCLLPTYDQWKPRDTPGVISNERRDELLLNDAYAAWLSRSDGVTPTKLREQWCASGRTCADALYALFGAFYLGAAGLLIDVLDETDGHPADAVRAARELVHEAQWGRRDDWALAHLRARKADFLARVGGFETASNARVSEAYSRLGALMAGGVPARVDPEEALRRDVERDDEPGAPLGWTAYSSAVSGLTVLEAIAAVEASHATSDPVVGIAIEGGGSGPSDVARLLSRPTSVEVRAVSVGWAPLGEVVSALVTAPHFRQQRVSLAGDSLSSHDLEALGNSEVQVTGLRVRDGRVGPEGFHTLTRGPAFSALRELVLPNSHGKNDAIEGWANAGLTRHLRRLSLVNNYSGASVDRFESGAARAILGSSMPHLRHLSLGDQQVGEEGAAAFGRNDSLVSLEALALEGCGLNGEAVAALMRCPSLGALRTLDLNRNSVGPTGAAAVARCERMRGLTYLRLFAIEDEGAVALAGAEFTALAALELERGRVGDDGAIALAGAPWLASVRHLGLDDNRITVRGAEALASSPYARSIERIELYQNPLGEAGVRALLALPALKTLQAYETSVPREAAEALRALRPDVALTLGGPWSDGLNPK